MAVLNFTSREFRTQQARVFDLADNGAQIVITRQKKRAYTLVPFDIEEDVTISPYLQAKIERAREELRKGETVKCDTWEDSLKLFESL